MLLILLWRTPVFVNNKNFHMDRLASLSEQSLPHNQIHIIGASKPSIWPHH